MRAGVLLTTSDLRKYPFLPAALDRIRELGLSLADLAAGPLRGVVERAISYIRLAARGEELPPPAEDCDEEVLAFMLSLIILKLVGDRVLTRRFAVAYARRARSFMREEDGEKLLYVLGALGVRAVRLGEPRHGYSIAVDVFSYVECAPERAGPWKLVHRLVDGGLVLVSRYEAVRLGEEALRRHIERRVEGLDVDESQLPDELYRLVEELSSEWGAYLRRVREAWSGAGGEAREDAFPPCIRAIIDDLRAGKNIPHSARFALASFLLNVGMSVEEVLDVFRSAPDFREDIARYQVEHIAGMRGSGKKYLPYKCDNMRSLGLCRWECEVGGRRIRHPLQYYYASLRGRRVKPKS
ncbi:MAG: hypothetical protein DRJ67_06270 [Thermoprotei archaeon]|nr:MAG: hypothetical protein DRJ67_06270 [Thermoprotei archaeon]